MNKHTKSTSSNKLSNSRERLVFSLYYNIKELKKLNKLKKLNMKKTEQIDKTEPELFSKLYFSWGKMLTNLIELNFSTHKTELFNQLKCSTFQPKTELFNY